MAKYQGNRTKIVDFSLMETFWGSLIFYLSVFTCGISLRHEKNNLLLHKMSDVLYLKKCGTLPFSHQKVTWNSFDKWRKLPKLQAIFGLAKNKSNQRDGYVYVSCKCLPLPPVVVSLNLNRNFTLDLTHSAKNLQPLTFFCTLLRRVFSSSNGS